MTRQILKNQSGAVVEEVRLLSIGGYRSCLAWLLLASWVVLLALSARANPIGMTTVRGSATTTQNGSQLNVTASSGAVLNWQSFNIHPGETTTFVQPSSTSIVWNRVLDPNLSQIWGTLNANGWVVLMNQNGFYFGPNSVINVHGLMVTTSPVAPESSGIGGLWQFNGTPPLASIINYGEIKAETGGSVFLVSERVENHGTISAPGGSIGLYAGKEVLVSERPDARGISATVKLPAGSVDNSGKLIADAGTIALHAQVVNQNGVINANSVREHNGVIELVASDSVNLGAASVLQAKGDDNGVSDAGSITVKSVQTFTDAAGSRIEVSGGAQGGNGGAVEISAPKMASIHSQINGGATAGWRGGSLVLDPTDIVLSRDGSDTIGSGTVLAGDSPDTLRLNVNSAFVGFHSIRLEATRDISLAPSTTWNLNDSTGTSDPGSLLTLEAGRNILFGDGSGITAASGWSVRLAAGVDFASLQHSVRNGIGGIYLNGGVPDITGARPNGSGSIETTTGSILLEAGHEILVGSGFIRTIGAHIKGTATGGSIDLTTGDGDVDAGTKADGYKFGVSLPSTPGSGYDISPNGLGGIGTEYGGNVTIHSGRDILSFIPTVGAYGAGDVTLVAANRILGKFIVRDGHGVINAGTLGSGDSPVSLSLVSGGWTAHARDIYLNEVLNPNGAFNKDLVGRIILGVNDKVRFRFDYAADAYVNLRGDNSVQLLGNNVGHGDGNGDRLPIYPPQLDIHAGAGGVVMGNDVILYPSSQGHLKISTTDGGSLVSTPGGFRQLVMSDSGSTDYHLFSSGHAAIPLHLNNPDPVSLVVDGGIQNIFLRSPKRADISIGGNALNFTFEGQNLAVGDVSSISIKGDYFSRSDRTFEVLTDQNPPNQETFNHIFVDRIYVADRDLAAHVTYNPVTHTLGFQGVMTEAARDFLLHPMIRDYDTATGRLRVDAFGNPILLAAPFSMDAAAINSLYVRSQDIPTSGLAYSGMQIGGPGTLAISARNMDLGISHGIRSVGTSLNRSLQSVLYPGGHALPGANLTLDLTGDSQDGRPSLTMAASQIASFNGGSINVTAAGNLNVGSQEQFTSDDTPKGIYTANGGNVSVTANRNIEINGSRIATYDGGNLNVSSTLGTVDTGGGARGFFTVATEQLSADGTSLEVRNDRFFGSGIVALTRRDSQSKVGNINVYAGVDIIAQSAGILQLAFNPTDKDHDATVDLTAKHAICTPSGVLGDIISEHAPIIKGLIVAQGNTPPCLNCGPGGGPPPPPGNVTGPQVSPPPPPPPPAPPPPPQSEDDKPAAAAKKDDAFEEQIKKPAPVLAKTTGRVTVILPEKK